MIMEYYVDLFTGEFHCTIKGKKLNCIGCPVDLFNCPKTKNYV